MKTTGIKNWSLTALLFAFALLWAPNTEAVTPASWKETGMAINANGMSLRDVFQEFSRTYGVRLSVSINDGRSVTGRLKAPTGAEFLDRLAQEYRFRWFVYNDTLYVAPNDDNVSMRLEVGEDAVQDAKVALQGLGLFESRFGWGELPDEGVVVVGGPRVYANLVRDILLPADKNAAKKAAAKGKQIMLFRLKYASATDRVINTRGKQETIPGIKTILSNLLLSGGTSAFERGNDLENDKFDPSSGKRSRQGKTASKGRAWEAEEGKQMVETRSSSSSRDDDKEQRAKKTAAARDDRPRIEADPALNAIMIYDSAGKRDMYQALINDLDIQPQQIEIEALIVDIDRSKLSEMGVEWGVTSRNGNNKYTMNSTNGDSAGTDLPLPGSTLLISNAARFYTRLKALEGNGQARILAKPTVLTLDNVAAVLDLSQTAYVSLVGERVADLADVTAGTMLRVVPRIVREGADTKVRLEVDIEDGSLNGDPTLKKGTTRSTISTQAIIDLQQTLMIGGYHADSLTVDNQKVPVLGDVPLFGNLFRSTSENHSTKERLFLITPRISGSSSREPAAYKEFQPGQIGQQVQAPAAPVAPAATATAVPTAAVAPATPAATVAPAVTAAPAPVVAAPAPATAAPAPTTVAAAKAAVAAAKAGAASAAAPVAAAMPAPVVAPTVAAASAPTPAVPAREMKVAVTPVVATAAPVSGKKQCTRPKGAALLPAPI